MNSRGREFIKNVRAKRNAHERLSKGPRPHPRLKAAKKAAQAAALALHETGYVDSNLVHNMDSSATLQLLNTIPQGAATTQRVGKKARMKSLQIRGHIRVSNSTDTHHGAVILIYDKRPTGSLPTPTDVLLTHTADSLNNDQNAPRFRILRRWDFSFCGSVTNGMTDSSMVILDEFVKLKNLPVVYKAAGTGGIGDIEQGALYILTTGDPGTVIGGTAAVLAGNCRLRYTDM